MPIADTSALQDALSGLSALVRGAPATTIAEDAGAGARRRRLLWHLEEYLLARVRDLDAPLVVVLLGSTGAGKSSLLNGLAGHRVSASGVTRPTTRRPLVLVSPSDAEAAANGRVLGALARADRLTLVVDDAGLPGIALVDAPDLDSVEEANRATADELLQAADVCLFVTTAQRYADAAPWDFLLRGRQRGVQLLVVVNRLPTSPADRVAVLEDCRRRFQEAGLAGSGLQGDLRFVEILEGALDPDVDGLTGSAARSVREELSALADDRRALGALKAHALRTALAGLPQLVGEVAADVEREAARAERLRGVVARSYALEQEDLERQLSAGDFLRGQVMKSWQEFVGVGEVTRLLATGVGRVRSWLVRQWRPDAAAPLLDAKERAFEDLVAALVRHADVAAGTAAAEWSADAGGAALVRADPSLWGHGAGLEVEARRALTSWLAQLTATVEERGQSRRAFAVVASLGVNAVGVVAMLAVFANSAGLTGGELAIAGGTAVLNQKLLEALIGEAAVADIVRRAGRELRTTLHAVLAGDAERFETALGARPVTAAGLRAASDRVVAAAERVLREVEPA